MLSKAKAAVKSFRAKRSFSLQNTPVILRSIDEGISSLQQRSEKNEEDVTIIWLTKEVKHPIDQSLIETLRSINDYIQIFDDEENALAYIETIFNEKVFLIIDYLSDHLLSLLEVLKQVDRIFLYTNTSFDTHSSRITAFCSTKEQLIDEIKYAREQLNKQMIVFSIFNQNNREKHDLTHEAGSFLFFQLFKAAFKKLPKNSESKSLMISKCRDYYSGNTKILEEIRNFEMNYKSNDAFQWYKNDSFICRLINKALRTENINCLCYFHFYISDLSKQLEKEYLKFKKQNSKCVIQFYRAFKTTKEEIKKFEQNIGNLILTNGYLSATRHRQFAQDFAMKLSNEEKVLFEYTVDINLSKSIIFADISHYNPSEENEILFDLGTAFKINSCQYNIKENIWIVNASGTDEGVDVASEYIEYQKAKMTESNIILTFGNLIIEIGDYDKAEKYFHAILHSSIPNDEEIACIYYSIGRVYRLKGEYVRALEFLNRAYVSHSEARPARLTSAAKTMNAMGIVYMEENDVEQAIESFECALKLYTKTIQEYHPDVAGTLINLGNIYSEQGEFEDALFCFNRAQKIYQSNLPSNHPNLAILYNNFGNLYYQQLKLDLALDAYERALAINEKMLPPNHPDVARSRQNLSKVYVMIGDQKRAEMEYPPAPEYSLVVTPQFIESTKNNAFQWETPKIDETSKPKMEVTEMNNC